MCIRDSPYSGPPKITGMLGAAIGLRDRFWRAELEASGAFARTTSLDGMAEVKASVGRWAIGARGCGVPTRGRIEVPLCAAIEAGQLVGQGKGATSNPHTKGRPWLAAVIGPALAVAIVPRLAIV